MTNKKLYCVLIIVLLLVINLLPPSLGGETEEEEEEQEEEEEEDPYKDSDLDGFPNYMDYEEIPEEYNVSQNKTKRGTRSQPIISGNNWSLKYGEDQEYGAYIEDVNWNNSLYIYKANVPWIKIDNVTYDIPTDFTLLAMGHFSYTTFYMVYHYYSIRIEEEEYRIEIAWYIWKPMVRNTGKITIHTILASNHTQSHSLYAAYRIDFDIIDYINDRFYGFGTNGWSTQNRESIQFSTTPVEPTLGIKVKQQDCNSPNSWAGIKPWNSNSINFLLRYNSGENRGNPNSYLNGQITYQADDLIWTTSSTSGKSPIWCGPTLYLH